MWRSCCKVMISPRPGTMGALVSCIGIAGLAVSWAFAAALPSIVAPIKPAKISLMGSSFGSRLARWRKMLAACLGEGRLARLIERGTGKRCCKRGIDGFQPVAGGARLRIVSKHRVDPFDAAIGHQEALGAVEIHRPGLDRIGEFLGVVGRRLGIRLDAGTGRNVGVENVELE